MYLPNVYAKQGKQNLLDKYIIEIKFVFSIILQLINNVTTH